MAKQRLESTDYQAELEIQNQALRYSQQAAEGALERFSALFSGVPLALMLVDENGLVLENNAMALRLFRPLESDAPIVFLQPLIAAGLSELVTKAFANAKAVGRCEISEITVLAGAQGTVTGDLHIARIHNPQDELAHFICAFVDQGPLLAERLALKENAVQLERRNQEIRQIEAELRESQKMQAIGTMAGGIAHDFNNILAAILGNVELARQDTAVASPAHTSLIEIEKAGRRARDLVRQILTFSRKEPPRRERVDLPDVVTEVVRLVRMNLPENVELQVLVDPATPAVLAEATQVQQALLNLCSNAIHAIGSTRGTVTIELGGVMPGWATTATTVTTERRSTARGLQVRLAVRDTGTGIDADTVQRVFEPFFTTKPTGQGTGLGLAVVHGVMRAHQGHAHVKSTPGLGSVFTLNFPAGPVANIASAEPSQKTTAPVDATVSQGQHVMYVDDDRALVFLVERALKRRGMRVSSFTDPIAALGAMRANPNDFDLVVTDHNMPGFSGIELLQAARAIRADLPVALASGYVTTEIEQAAFAAGAKALIHKPNDVNEMVETVQRLILDSASSRNIASSQQAG